MYDNDMKSCILHVTNYYDGAKHIGYSVYVGNIVFTRNVVRDSYRDLTAYVSNSVSVNGALAVPISEYYYTYDVAGRRTNRVDKRYGASAATNRFNYSTESEIINTDMNGKTNNYEYLQYGTRSRTIDYDTNTLREYSWNSLNQYTSIIERDKVSLNQKSRVNTYYDADGNLTYTYTNGYSNLYLYYDSENRLETYYSWDSSFSRNFYDHLSRRIAKSAYTPNSQSHNYTYIYDDWNLIAEIENTGTHTNITHYIWNLDLSGTPQGAGGIGGLVAVCKNGEWYVPLYDANGNVTEYVDESGVVVAHYEYDAFGNTIVQSGPLADTFRFRFSTKYYDEETGLYYYGYRYYSPELGRFISRDPMEEQGGMNLYTFCENDPVNTIDALGLYYYDFSLEELLVAPNAQSQINGFSDALAHYRSGAGGVVSAGTGLYAEMRAHPTYLFRVKSENGWVASRIKNKLRNVPKNLVTGTIQADPGSYVGNLESKTLGSYRLLISYEATWKANLWKRRWHAFLTGQCYREISSTVTVNFTLSDSWDFRWNPGYTAFQNLRREVIPGWIANAIGTPAEFTITGKLSETYKLKVEQDK